MKWRAFNPRALGWKGYLWVFVLAGIMVAAVVGLLVKAPTELSELWKRLEGFIRLHPIFAVVFAAIVPGLPIPASFAFILLGVAWSSDPLLACLLGMLALSVNFTWTYLLSSSYGRVFFRAVVARWGRELPTFENGKEVPVIFIVRLTPGLPLFIQSYALGLLGVPFGKYLGLSMLISGPVATGVVLSGAGVAEGRWEILTYGVAIAATSYLLIWYLRSRRNKTRSNKTQRSQ